MSYGGYAYGVGKRHPDRIIYYCERYRHFKCQGCVIYYKDRNELILEREHDHEPDYLKIEADKFKVVSWILNFNHIFKAKSSKRSE